MSGFASNRTFFRLEDGVLTLAYDWDTLYEKPVYTATVALDLPEKAIVGTIDSLKATPPATALKITEFLEYHFGVSNLSFTCVAGTYDYDYAIQQMRHAEPYEPITERAVSELMGFNPHTLRYLIHAWKIVDTICEETEIIEAVNRNLDAVDRIADELEAELAATSITSASRATLSAKFLFS